MLYCYIAVLLYCWIVGLRNDSVLLSTAENRPFCVQSSGCLHVLMEIFFLRQTTQKISSAGYRCKMHQSASVCISLHQYPMQFASLCINNCNILHHSNLSQGGKNITSRLLLHKSESTMHNLRIVTLRHIIVTPLSPTHSRFAAFCDDVTINYTYHPLFTHFFMLQVVEESP